MDLMDDIGSQSLPPDAPDQSVASWLRQQGASERMLAIAEACYANDFGCSLEDLGLRECIIENQRWEAGEPVASPEVKALSSNASMACRAGAMWMVCQHEPV